METEGSITQWIRALRQDRDETAANELWATYFDRLVRHIRPKIAAQFRKMSDEEDVALSALDTLFRGIRADRYPQLNDRESLWNLLLTLAERRMMRHYRRETTQKRGGGKVLGEDAAGDTADDASAAARANFVVDAGPTPEFVATIMDELAARLGQLKDPTLHEMAILELEGYSPQEIQQRLNLGSERTYFRKKKLLQSMWREFAAGDG